MAEEIDFENHHFWNFKSHVTLTLTSDDLESHIIMNVSSTLTNITIWFVAALCFIADVQTDGRMYSRTDIFIGFIRSSLKRWPKKLFTFRVRSVDAYTIKIHITHWIHTWIRFIAVNQIKFRWPARSNTNLFSACLLCTITSLLPSSAVKSEMSLSLLQQHLVTLNNPNNVWSA